MFSLSHDEMSAVIEAARPIQRSRREEFFLEVMDEVQKYPEDRSRHRGLRREVQRQHFTPPPRHHTGSKWAWAALAPPLCQRLIWYDWCTYPDMCA